MIIVYIIPVLICLLGYRLYDWPSPKKRTGLWLWRLLLIYLVALMGLRYKVGGDTYNYMTFFQWSPELSEWQVVNTALFEPGFTLLTSAIKTMVDDIYVYQSVLSFILTFLLMRFIRKNTAYKFLGMLFLYIAVYLYFSTEIMRESLAVAGFVTAYSLWERKKFILYFFVALLLGTFHASGLITLFIPFASRIKFSSNFFPVMVVCVCIFMMIKPLTYMLSSYEYFEKLLRFNEQDYVGYAWVGLRFIYFGVLPFFVLFQNKHLFHLSCKYEGIICLQILLSIGMWFNPIIFQRLINYTIVFYLVSLAEVMGIVLRSKQYKQLSLNTIRFKRQMSSSIIILTLLAHFTYYIHLGFYERYIPYHSAFDPIEVPGRAKFVAGDGEK